MSADMSDWRDLAALLRKRSLERGDFTLSSGERSDYYIDARRTTMSGRGQLLIGRLGLAVLDDAGWKPVAVGGLTLGADPVAYAIAHAAAAAGWTLDAFTVRKAPKEHGTGRQIEGAWGIEDGPSNIVDGAADVVVIEDVVTTGGSALRAIDQVTGSGGRVLGVLALVDREQGGRERIRNAGYPLSSVFRVSELLTEDRESTTG